MMDEDRCQVCRGRRTIRLGLHRPVTLAGAAALPSELVVSSREYPCPECAPLATLDQVRVLECHFQVDTRYEEEQGYREHMVSHGIHMLAREMEKAGLVRMQTAPVPDSDSVYDLSRGYRLSVGIVSPKVARDLDVRREEAEERFARLVLAIAMRQIDNWGSYYRRGDISKRDAIRLVSEALDAAKRQRPK
jgi:hypothetical protein